MKRFTSLLLMFLCGTLVAGNIPEQKARAFAEAFLSQSPLITKATLQLEMVYCGETPPTRMVLDDPPFYVFNNVNGKGFVIVSGDDRTLPVLGYSFEGNIDTNDPAPELMAHLRLFEKEIGSLRSHDSASSHDVREAWRSPAVPTVKKQLETASWGQSGAFNRMTPIMPGDTKRSVTGCVITAACIAMKYHGYPEKGIGVAPAYKSKGIQLGPLDLGHPYHWDNMPGKAPYTEEQELEISRLMADVGIMFNAEYSQKGTTVKKNVPFVLTTYMQYDRSLERYDRTNFTQARWNELLRNNIDKDGPVIYTGYNEKDNGSSGGGHCFILDGYADHNYFHVNWGWSGGGNGLFLLTALGNGSHFNLNQSAVLHMIPNEGGTPTPLLQYYDDPNGRNGIRGYDAEAPWGTEHKIQAGRFVNSSYVDFTGEVILAITDENGEIRSILDKVSYENLKPDVFRRGFDLTLTFQEGDLRPGDRLRCFFHSEGDPEGLWRLVRGTDRCTWDLPLFPAKDILRWVSMDFDANSRFISISARKVKEETKVEGLQVHFYRTGNEDDTREAVVLDDGSFKIDTAILEPGTYHLRFSGKNYPTREIRIILGERIR